MHFEIMDSQEFCKFYIKIIIFIHARNKGNSTLTKYNTYSHQMPAYDAPKPKKLISPNCALMYFVTGQANLDHGVTVFRPSPDLKF